MFFTAFLCVYFEIIQNSKQKAKQYTEILILCVSQSAFEQQGSVASLLGLAKSIYCELPSFIWQKELSLISRS